MQPPLLGSSEALKPWHSALCECGHARRLLEELASLFYSSDPPSSELRLRGLCYGCMNTYEDLGIYRQVTATL